MIGVGVVDAFDNLSWELLESLIGLDCFFDESVRGTGILGAFFRSSPLELSSFLDLSMCLPERITPTFFVSSSLRDISATFRDIFFLPDLSEIDLFSGFDGFISVPF